MRYKYTVRLDTVINRYVAEYDNDTNGLRVRQTFIIPDWGITRGLGDKIGLPDEVEEFLDLNYHFSVQQAEKQKEAIQPQVAA